MQNIRRQFLLSSVEKLRDLQAKIEQSENISKEFVNELFRSLHTVKGTAQTLGLSSASSFAHELENFLSAAQNDHFTPNKNLLIEGFECLIRLLETKDFQIPVNLIEKFRAETPNQIFSNFSDFELPEKISTRLSEQEKEVVFTALQNGENLFCIEAGFTFADFAEELKTFREKLNRCGRVIAALPGEKPGAEISFRLLFSGKTQNSDFEQLLQDSSAEIVFQKTATVNYEEDLHGALTQIATHGKNTAFNLGKAIEFEVITEVAEIPSAQIKIIFDALLHLVRNAVDHAIETTGERIAKDKNAKGIIRISLREQVNKLSLTVADDGAGIDLEKIKAKAIENNRISADKVLTEQETLDLIFLPGFSTAEQVSEISGRGVGLDAVKNMIENAGGEISIQTRKDAGTTFEILLPL